MPKPPDGVYGRGSDELKLVDANGGEADDDAEADGEADEVYEDEDDAYDEDGAEARLLSAGSAHARSTTAAAATESVRPRMLSAEFCESEKVWIARRYIPSLLNRFERILGPMRAVHRQPSSPASNGTGMNDAGLDSGRSLRTDRLHRSRVLGRLVRCRTAHRCARGMVPSANSKPRSGAGGADAMVGRSALGRSGPSSVKADVPPDALHHGASLLALAATVGLALVPSPDRCPWPISFEGDYQTNAALTFRPCRRDEATRILLDPTTYCGFMFST